MQRQNWFDVKEIAAGTYMVTEGERYKFYLLVGQERALLIDAGIGVGDVGLLVRSITSLDVEVALTHGHWDHIGGAHLFKKIGIHALDRDLATKELHPKMQERAQMFIRDWKKAGKFFPPDFSTQDFKVLPCHVTHEFNNGDIIDIGGSRIKTFHTPGHSPGSISFLDESSGILFVGDAVKPREAQYAHLPGSDLKSYAASMELLASHAGEVKVICSGHTEPYYDPSILAEMADGFEGAVSGRHQPHQVDTDWGNLKEYSFDRFSIWVR